MAVVCFFAWTFVILSVIWHNWLALVGWFVAFVTVALVLAFCVDTIREDERKFRS